MLYSEHPCAIARMLTLALARAEKRVADTPLRWFMFCPTAARMLHPEIFSTLAMPPLASASAKRSLMAATAWSSSAERTAKQIECSEEACEIMTTLTPASRTAEKMPLAVPGTPTMPVPSTEMSVMLSMVAKPLTRPSRLSLGSLFSSSLASVMSVPGEESSKKLRMQIGILNFIAGSVVRGWSTLAPKYESSQASLYDSFSRHTAPRTVRGSAE
mmetsp:Transcript_23921/g.74814  ORF Transcript_23921/g.74814 Transcript_23921/m.74814 type:complete len:215 (+) Transcript_23921:1327-1971(+)